MTADKARRRKKVADQARRRLPELEKTRRTTKPPAQDDLQACANVAGITRAQAKLFLKAAAERKRITVREPDDGASRQPMAFDFSQDPEPPDWRVAGLIERGTLTVLSGDHSSAKTIASYWLVRAALKQQDWLGHWVRPCPVIYIDEENPWRLVHARLRAMGLSNKETKRLRYFNRIGAQVGADDWLDWLIDQVKETHAGLVIIDGASAATVAKVNDNDEVAALMKDLRRITDAGADVIILHHERKPQRDAPTANTGTAMMGARHWANQADNHLTLAQASPFVEDDPDDDGLIHARRTFTLEAAKIRSGGFYKRSLLLSSAMTEERALLQMRLEVVEDHAAESRAQALHDRVLTYVKENPGKSQTAIRSELGGNAAAVGKTLKALVRKKQLRTEPAKRGGYTYYAVEGAEDLVLATRSGGAS